MAVCPFTPTPTVFRNDCALKTDGKCAITVIAESLSDREDHDNQGHE